MIDMVIAALVERSTNRVLDAILRTDDARVQALQGIDRKVTDLRQGPFYAGVRFLAEANKPHRDDEGRRQDLLAARTAFFNALGNERSSPARMGLVTAYLALTHFVLGSYLDTEAFLEESHEHFWRAYVPPKPRSGVLAGMIGSPPLDTTLLPYLDWITGLRVGLGAHPRSVPRIVIADRARTARERRWAIEWGQLTWLPAREIPSRSADRRMSRSARYALPEPRVPRGRRALGSVGARWLRVDRPELDVWDVLIAASTNELIHVATGGDPPRSPRYAWVLWRLRRQRRVGLPGGHWTQLELATVRRVAVDIVADRRTGWPNDQRKALQPEMRALLWPPKADTTPFDWDPERFLLPRTRPARLPPGSRRQPRRDDRDRS